MYTTYEWRKDEWRHADSLYDVNSETDDGGDDDDEGENDLRHAEVVGHQTAVRRQHSVRASVVGVFVIHVRHDVTVQSKLRISVLNHVRRAIPGFLTWMV